MNHWSSLDAAMVLIVATLCLVTIILAFGAVLR